MWCKLSLPWEDQSLFCPGSPEAQGRAEQGTDGGHLCVRRAHMEQVRRVAFSPEDNASKLWQPRQLHFQKMAGKLWSCKPRRQEEVNLIKQLLR